MPCPLFGGWPNKYLSRKKVSAPESQVIHKLCSTSIWMKGISIVSSCRQHALSVDKGKVVVYSVGFAEFDADGLAMSPNVAHG